MPGSNFSRIVLPVLLVLAVPLFAAPRGGRGGGGGGGGGTPGAGQQKPDDNKDTYTLAQEALAAKNFQAGIYQLEQFITSSVGDPRADKANKQLHEALVSLAKEFEAADRDVEAAMLYLKLAELFPKEKDTYSKQASTTLISALTESQAKRQEDRALQIFRGWTRLFPDQPPLLSAEQVAALSADATIAACQDKLNLLALPDVVEHYYPDKAVPWAALAKKNRDEALYAGYLRSLASLGWTGRYIAEYQKLDTDSPLRSDKAFAAQTEKVFLRRVEAFVALGNLPLATQALATARAEITNDAFLASLRALEAKLPPNVKDTIGGGGNEARQRDLAFANPINGKTSWNDKGEGFREAKDVVLDDGADVTVKAGFVLNGGKINLKKATLHLKGTAEKPVIFRNVHFELELGGHLDADNAVLMNCTFSKTGGWFSSHSAKWTFVESILYRSRFSGFSQTDYGIQVDKSAIVECVIPDRSVRSSDYANAYSGRWDMMTNSTFYRTRLSPSSMWLTTKSNFIRCQVSKDEFHSRTPMLIPLFAPDFDPISSQLRTRTAITDTAMIQYGFARTPFPLATPANLWSLLPVDMPDVTKDRK